MNSSYISGNVLCTLDSGWFRNGSQLYKKSTDKLLSVTRTSFCLSLQTSFLYIFIPPPIDQTYSSLQNTVCHFLLFIALLPVTCVVYTYEICHKAPCYHKITLYTRRVLPFRCGAPEKHDYQRWISYIPQRSAHLKTSISSI